MRERYLGAALILLGVIGSPLACSAPDVDGGPRGRRPPAASDEDGGTEGPDATTPDEDPDVDGDPDGGGPPECPYPAEPSTGKFSKIYDPSSGGTSFYINDHTFVRDDAGTWHLFGITHAEPADPFDEKTFAHATAPGLHGPWTKKAPALVADPTYGETLLWAPFVLHEGATYYMFYCGGGSDRASFQIQLATSSDLVNWTREPAPLFRDGYDARDPMVLRVGNQWVLYYTANSAPAGGNHVVAYRTSTDLRNWGEKKIAFTDPTIGTYAGPTESPFVVPRGNDYYLFIGPREAYSDTAVFHSKDPFHFDPNDQVHRFVSHAAEVVQDVDGKTYASHSGWEQGGVHLTPLDWLPTRCRKLEGKSYRATIQTAPRAGILELEVGGRNLLSSGFRRTGPYLGIGGFGTNAAGAAKSVVVSPDGKRVDLKGISFGERPVTADWALCANDDALDQRIVWHVDKALDGVHEVALGVSTRLAQVRDETNVKAEGDFPGLTSWSLLGDGTTSLIAAYASTTAWREDNRWLSSKRSTAAFQPLWSSSGLSLPAGDYRGGLYRLLATTKPDDVTKAADVASTLAAAKTTCPLP